MQGPELKSEVIKVVNLTSHLQNSIWKRNETKGTKGKEAVKTVWLTYWMRKPVEQNHNVRLKFYQKWLCLVTWFVWIKFVCLIYSDVKCCDVSSIMTKLRTLVVCSLQLPSWGQGCARALCALLKWWSERHPLKEQIRYGSCAVHIAYVHPMYILCSSRHPRLYTGYAHIDGDNFCALSLIQVKSILYFTE